jgi:hypothetical protein
MKTRSFFACLIVACSCFYLFVPTLRAQANEGRPQMDSGEMKALQAIQAAPDLNAKLSAADAYVKKYPKSLAQKRVAGELLKQIAGVTDLTQKLALLQSFSKIFTDEAEIKQVEPILIATQIGLKQFDEAFSAAATFLPKNPEDIQDLINLTIAATEQAKQGNPKFVKPGKDYGTAAIAMLEADRKPAYVDVANWDSYKKMMPDLYQEMAVISLMDHNATDAQANLGKAMKLNPSDPFNYVLSAGVVNDEYQRTAQTYKTMPESKAKTDMLQRATDLLDNVIDLQAHAVALSEGRPEYQKLHDQELSDLTIYFKYRHHNATDGLQQLIDKYKPAAKP